MYRDVALRRTVGVVGTKDVIHDTSFLTCVGDTLIQFDKDVTKYLCVMGGIAKRTSINGTCYSTSRKGNCGGVCGRCLTLSPSACVLICSGIPVGRVGVGQSTAAVQVTAYGTSCDVDTDCSQNVCQITAAKYVISYVTSVIVYGGVTVYNLHVTSAVQVICHGSGLHGNACVAAYGTLVTASVNIPK